MIKENVSSLLLILSAASLSVKSRLKVTTPERIAKRSTPSSNNVYQVEQD